MRNLIYISRAVDPAEEVLAWVHEHSADITHLGSRGRDPLGAFRSSACRRAVAVRVDRNREALR
jgi:hypothetical protein